MPEITAFPFLQAALECPLQIVLISPPCVPSSRIICDLCTLCCPHNAQLSGTIPNPIFPGIAPGTYITTSPRLTSLLRLGLGRLKHGLRGLLVSREVIRELSHPLPIVFGGSVPSRRRLRLEPPASEDPVLPLPPVHGHRLWPSPAPGCSPPHHGFSHRTTSLSQLHTDY